MAVTTPLPERKTPLPAPDEPEDPTVAPLKLAVGTVSHGGFEVVVEGLPPVAADGRVLVPGGNGTLTPISRAAAALAQRGEFRAHPSSPRSAST